MSSPVPIEDESWHVVGASVVGTSHTVDNRECEDAHAWRPGSDGLVLAVADGAGSARCSKLGAQLVVEAALQRSFPLVTGPPVPMEEWEGAMRAVLEGVREDVARAAEEKRAAPSSAPRPDEPCAFCDFAATLLLVVVRVGVVAFLHVGDGAIVLRRKRDTFQVVSPGMRGEYANETFFITSNEYADGTYIDAIAADDVTGVAMLSDGVEGVAIHKPTAQPHAEFFLPMFAYAAKPESDPSVLEEFLASERVCEKTDDDKTLVLAVQVA